jgi:1-acyl-sn-glycerol-3-phosphate acyltransferase
MAEKTTTRRKTTRKAKAAEPVNGAEPQAEKPKKRRRKAAEAEATAPHAETAAPETEAHTEEPSVNDESLRAELLQHIDELIKRLRALSPGYTPPQFSASNLVNMVEENLDKVSPEAGLGLLSKLRGAINSEMLDVDTWKGMLYMLNYSVQSQGDVLKRRVTGEYETDEWGFDREFLDAILPFADFLYSKYWRVEMNGLDNVPAEGRGLLVANHSGQLPFDGMMLGTGILRNHPSARLTRTLYATWFPTLPFLSDIFVKCGQVMATEDNGIRLLENNELTAVFPEGYKGVGKLFKDRYRLARFGRGGFVRMALKARAPIIPVSIVGAEETYISLAKSDLLAKLTGFPYFPISPTFPWTGLFGLIPLPTKWYIDIGEPMPMDVYGPNAANNLVLISQLTDQVRNVVQEMIVKRLALRKNVFFG